MEYIYVYYIHPSSKYTENVCLLTKSIHITAADTSLILPLNEK